MAKHNHPRPHSDQLIRRTFGDYLRSGMHIMLAFAKTASEYALSMDTIRKIVMRKRKKKNRT